MNAHRDFALEKAVTKVEECLVKHPEGMYISQISSMAKINTDMAKRALAILRAVENNQLWQLPDDDAALVESVAPVTIVQSTDAPAPVIASVDTYAQAPAPQTKPAAATKQKAAKAGQPGTVEFDDTLLTVAVPARLLKPCRVGSAVFRPGVATMLMIEHAERLYEAYEKPAQPPAPALLQQFAKVLTGELVIVPAQPTAAMISAGNACNSLLDDVELQTLNIYAAMLQVAKGELNV